MILAAAGPFCYDRRMGSSLLVVLAVAGAADVAVSVSFVPPTRGARAAGVAVSFSPRDPDFRVNEEPAPRLKLDEAQKVLLGQKPAKAAPAETPKAGEFKYLDTAVPFVFPVSLGPGARPGAHSVRGAVTFFYCSKRDGWCRKGAADVEIPVSIE